MNSRATCPPAVDPALHFLPADTPPAGPPLFLLHGWGHSRHSWDALMPYLADRDRYLLDLPGFGDSRGWRPADLGETLRAIGQRLPETCVLIGWSLGGHLALRLARSYPEKVAGVVTLATNLRFVAGEDYATAMAGQTFRDFCNGFAASPEQTLKRFCGLQAQGDGHGRTLLKTLREQCPPPEPTDMAEWRRALESLGQFDHRQELPHLPMPLLHVFADGDALVPRAAADAVALVSPGTVEVLHQAGHAFPISRPQETARLIKGLCVGAGVPGPGSIDKKRMARSFSRAAATYDSVAHIQTGAGERLLNLAPPVAGQPVLDLGCGTGFCGLHLRQRGAEVTGLDIAPGMLRQARAKLGPDPGLVCADAEQLPFAPGGFAGVVSNLTVQWSQALPRLLRELWHSLEPGGWLLFSTLGPATLGELREAWRVVDGGRHVNDFVAAPALQALLEGAGFALECFETETRVPRYRQLGDLMHELKTLGAHNVSSEQRRGLTPPADLRRLIAAYEAYRDAGGMLPATYELFYILARRPAAPLQADS